MLFRVAVGGTSPTVREGSIAQVEVLPNGRAIAPQVSNTLFPTKRFVNQVRGTGCDSLIEPDKTTEEESCLT